MIKMYYIYYYTVHLLIRKGNVIYHLSDIRMDVSNIGSKNPEGNLTNTFICANILRDDYVIHFLAFQLERFDYSSKPLSTLRSVTIYVEVNHVI